MKRITKILTLTTASMALVPLLSICSKNTEVKVVDTSLMSHHYGINQQISDESNWANDNLVGKIEGEYLFDKYELFAALTIVSDDGSKHDEGFKQQAYIIDICSIPTTYRIQSGNGKAYFEIDLENNRDFPILYINVQSAYSTKPTNYVIGWYE